MNDPLDWTNDSDDLLAKLISSWRGSQTESILVARYPDHRSVLWFAGLPTPIDASEEALDRLVDEGYLSWDESPRPLRRVRLTAAGLRYARALRPSWLAGGD